MKAKHHFWTSAALGAIAYTATDSATAIVGCMIGGFLIDGDHIVDQIWSIRAASSKVGSSVTPSAQTMGWRSRLARMIRRRKLTRLPLIFHSYELAVALAAVTLYYKTPFLIGLLGGYVLHLALDLWRHYHELQSPLFYLLGYRLWHRFRRDSLVKADYI